MNFHPYYLQQMGIELWEKRRPSVLAALKALEDSVSQCTDCQNPSLSSNAKAVFGRGNAKATLMIIGDAPDEQESAAGLPFVGKQQSLLEKMLISIGLVKTDVYMTHVLKYQPEEHAGIDDLKIATRHAQQHLEQQIALISPKVLLALGPLAAQLLCNSSSSIDGLRGACHSYQALPCIVSYPLNQLLTHGHYKKEAYQDLLLVKSRL